MDQRAHAVEQDIKSIFQTRLALSSKLKLLERHVREQVQETKAALWDVLDHARSTAIDVVGQARRRLNPVVHAELRPWMVISSAVAVGFLVGWIDARRRASGVYPYYPPKADAADVMPSDRTPHEPPGVYPFYPVNAASLAGNWSSFSSLRDCLTYEFAKERERIQGAAMLIGREFVQQMVREVLPALMRSFAETQRIRRESLVHDPERPNQ